MIVTAVLFILIHILITLCFLLKFMNIGVYPLCAKHNNKRCPVLRSKYIENLTRQS